jgi:hypothetical protein
MVVGMVALLADLKGLTPVAGKVALMAVLKDDRIAELLV